MTAWCFLILFVGCGLGILLMCLMFMAREPRPNRPTPYGMGPLDVDTVTG